MIHCNRQFDIQPVKLSLTFENPQWTVDKHTERLSHLVSGSFRTFQLLVFLPYRGGQQYTEIYKEVILKGSAIIIVTSQKEIEDFLWVFIGSAR